MTEIQRQQLIETKAGAIEQFEHGAISNTGKGIRFRQV